MSAPPRVLDVGCGRDKTPGAIGLDINPRSDADVRCDLNQLPYPFRDNTFDAIVCTSVLEHLDDFVGVMEELHRIARPGALLRIVVPFFASHWSHTDPTHRRVFATHSFDYFDERAALHKYKYSDARYAVERVEFEKPPPYLRRRIEQPLRWLANRFKDTYEARFAYLYPMHDLYFELRVIK